MNEPVPDYTPELRRRRRLMSQLSVSMLKETIQQVESLNKDLDEEGRAVNQQALEILREALVPLQANADLYGR